MYSVGLDKDGYFTGSFAKIGSIPNGIMVNTLPNEKDNNKIRYWKYDYHDVNTVVKTPVMDEETGNQKIDEAGELLFTETIVVQNILEWFFDSIKYNEDMLLKIKYEKIKFIDNYKHEARMYFPYGNVGGIQRFNDQDINFINLTMAGLQSGRITEVYWKYSNGEYDKVTSVDYFENMLLTGGMLINKAFSTELTVINEIKAFTELDALLAYNEKARFDELFSASEEG